MKSFVLLIALASVTSTLANEPINVCKGTANGVFLANITDSTCSGYIVCMNEVAYSQNCPINLLFNPMTQQCENSENVSCGLCKNNNRSVYQTQYPNQCNRYILCFGGIPVLQQCNDNLQYDSAQERCNFAQLVDCVANKCDSNIDDTSAITMVPSSKNCSNYFICYDGSPFHFECGNNFVWDNEVRGCIIKGQNKTCANAAAQARAQIPYSIQPPQVARNVICPAGEGAHFLPNVENKSSYIVCGQGKAFILTCAYGLEYDESTESCRDPSLI